jgi:hypothetical protein
LPPWHSGFNQLSLDPSTTLADFWELGIPKSVFL